MSLAGSRSVSQWLGVASRAQSAAQALEGNALDRNVQAALIMAGMLVLFSRRRELGRLLRANAPIIVFLLFGVASVLWSDYPGVAFKRWTKAIGDLVMALVVLTDLSRSEAIKQFVARVGFLLVPLSVLFIKYYPNLGLGFGGPAMNIRRYIGVTLDKNMLGVVCLMAGLGCSWRLIEAFKNREGARSAGPLMAQVALLVLVVWLFGIANSMTSVGCFLLAATVMVATSVPTIARKRAVVHLLVVATLGVAGAGLFLDVGSGIVETMGREQGLTGRTELWQTLLSTNEHPWLGAGFESYWLGTRLEKLWALYWWRPNEAHNGFLEVFLNLGGVGLAFLAIVIVTGYRNVVNSLHQDPDIGGLKLGFLVAALAYNFTEAGFRVLNPVWILFLMTAVAVPKPAVEKGLNPVASPAHGATAPRIPPGPPKPLIRVSDGSRITRPQLPARRSSAPRRQSTRSAN